MDLPLMRLEQQLRVVGKFLHHLQNYIRTNLIMVRTDRGPNPSDEVSRFGTKVFLHSMDCCGRDITQRSHPTGVGDADNPIARIMDQNGNTVGEAHKEREVRLIRQNNVRLAIGLILWTRRPRTDYVGTMHLPYIEHFLRRATKGTKGKDTILADAFEIIPHRPAHVE